MYTLIFNVLSAYLQYLHNIQRIVKTNNNAKVNDLFKT